MDKDNPALEAYMNSLGGIRSFKQHLEMLVRAQEKIAVRKYSAR